MRVKRTVQRDFYRVGNSLIVFLSESLVFCKKMSEWAICKKNKQFTHSLSFGERPEQNAHGHSFLGSDLSELHMVARFFKNRYKKRTKKYYFSQIFWSKSLFFVSKRVNEWFAQIKRVIGSFIISNLSKSLTVAHLTWVTWAIHSQSLICPFLTSSFVHQWNPPMGIFTILDKISPCYWNFSKSPGVWYPW